MEVSRQELRGLFRRSTRDASDKENICPDFEASLVAVEMINSRRSPLPVGFPRSPLQDITHIIYPRNTRHEEDDQLLQPIPKKCKKGNSVEGCAHSANSRNSASWKGLRSCVHLRLQTEDPQAEETTSDKVDSVLNLPVLMESSSKGRCIDESKSNFSVSNAPLCEMEAELSIERGKSIPQACSAEHEEDDAGNADVLNSLERCDDANLINPACFVHGDDAICSESNASVCDSSAASKESEKCIRRGKLVAHAQFLKNTKNNGDQGVQSVGNCSRLRQTVQLKKRSTLLMLR